MEDCSDESASQRYATVEPNAPPSEPLAGTLRRYPHLTISPAILVALLAGWWLASHVLGAPAYVLPAPEQVLQALLQGLARAPWDKAGLWYHSGITVWEALLGFAAGSTMGAFLGIAFSHWPILGKSWYPYIVGFQSLPKVALAPLMVVWFGFGVEGKVFNTAVMTFFPVLVNIMAGYQSVEPERIELARSCNAGEWQLLSKIIIPSCLPFLFAGLGVASVMSIIGAVVAEFAGASAGLGMLLMQYNQSLEIAPLFAVIVLLGVIGFLMNHAVGLAERYYCFWAQRAHMWNRV
jgi:NitT/TauT family transport system permease protein